MDDASNNSFQNKITDEEIKNLPGNYFSGRIYVIEHLQQYAFLEKKLENVKVIGFDTETRPSFKKGRTYRVALLQIATSNEAFLVRLNKVGLSNILIRIFENEQIVKVGLAIRDDLKALKKLKHFEPKGFIDLQDYVKKFDIIDNGLKKLAANILGFKISKKQQTSNWENEVLNDEQCKYAATDAWVCYMIYLTLNKYMSDGQSG